jgi:hypothetical protein
VSRELVITVEATPVERSRAEVAAIPLFSGERPLRGAAGRLDWRLCGRLSDLVVGGRLAGERGEAALIASFGGLRARLLLVLGAGERAAFDARSIEVFAAEAVARGIALRAGSLALPGADALADVTGHDQRLAALLSGAARAVAAAPRPVSVEVRLLVPEEEETRAAEMLRRTRSARIPEGLTLRLPGSAPPRREDVPRSGAGMPPGARR